MKPFTEKFSFNREPFTIHYELDKAGKCVAKLRGRGRVLQSGSYESCDDAEKILKEIAKKLAYES